MKRYQLEAIKDLEKGIIYLNLKKLQDPGKNYEEAREAVEKCLGVLKNQFHSESLMEPILCVTIIIEFLHLTDFEKMNIFFDFIKPNLVCIDKQTTVFSVEIKEEMEKHGINWNQIAFFWKLAHNKEEEKEIFYKHYPNDAEFILKTIKDYTEDSESIKRSYQILKQEYYDEFRKPTTQGLPKIKSALENLRIKPYFIELLMRELSKVAKQKSDKKPAIPKIEIMPKKESKPLRSKQEWRELEQGIDNFYDIENDIPRHYLDLGEKIQLAAFLRELSYSEEKITEILWRSDELYSINSLTNTPKNKMRNAIIIKSMIEKARTNKTEISEFQKLLEEAQISYQTDDENKDLWKEMLFQLIDEENMEQTKKLKKINTDLSKINANQKAFWQNIFQEEIEINKHRAIVILEILLKNLNGCSKAEKILWKEKIKETLFRLQLEGIGNYNYELENSKDIQILKRNKENETTY